MYVVCGRGVAVTCRLSSRGLASYIVRCFSPDVLIESSRGSTMMHFVHQHELAQMVGMHKNTSSMSFQTHQGSWTCPARTRMYVLLCQARCSVAFRGLALLQIQRLVWLSAVMCSSRVVMRSRVRDAHEMRLSVHHIDAHR